MRLWVTLGKMKKKNLPYQSRHNNKSGNYMADMNLPSFSDDDEGDDEGENEVNISNIQYDDFGNEI